jgi:CTP synthase (UTP-ammonia lyase)
MHTGVKIGLLGDFNEAVQAHGAIPKALALAAGVAGGDGGSENVTYEWLASRDLPNGSALAATLGRYDGLWCVPGSPYENMEGVLSAIRHARTERIPFLGTCGGFQHAVIEYARDVAGIAGADHLESSPDAAAPVINRLSCSLVKVEREVRLLPGTRLAAIYGQSTATEGFQCNFGVNAEYRAPLERAGLRFSAVDEGGDIRAMELPEEKHPFFLGTRPRARSRGAPASFDGRRSWVVFLNLPEWLSPRRAR